MELLVIGGTGVLSSAVTQEALSKGIEVTMINRGNRPIPTGVKFIKADCKDSDYINSKLKGCCFDAVIDFICYSKEQLEHSLRLFLPYVKQYFFISSTAVIDCRTGDIFDEESAKVLPFWGYSVNKWDAEQFLTTALCPSDKHYTIIRPCVTYDDTRIPYGIAPRYGFHWTLAARAMAGKPIITWNGGVNRCNMMRVEDFAVGVVGLVGNEKAYNRAFNVCGDEAPSYKDVLEAFAKAADISIPTIDIPAPFFVSYCPQRKEEYLARTYDSIHSNARIKDAVPAFSQTITLSEGVSRTVNAYKSRNYQRGIDWAYDAQMDYVIRKWCQKNRINKRQYHLGFKNYLSNAFLKNRIAYWLAYHQDSLLVRLLRRIRG